MRRKMDLMNSRVPMTEEAIAAELETMRRRVAAATARATPAMRRLYDESMADYADWLRDTAAAYKKLYL